MLEEMTIVDDGSLLTDDQREEARKIINQARNGNSYSSEYFEELVLSCPYFGLITVFIGEEMIAACSIVSLNDSGTFFLKERLEKSNFPFHGECIFEKLVSAFNDETDALFILDISTKKKNKEVYKLFLKKLRSLVYKKKFFCIADTQQKDRLCQALYFTKTRTTLYQSS